MKLWDITIALFVIVLLLLATFVLVATCGHDQTKHSPSPGPSARRVHPTPAESSEAQDGPARASYDDLGGVFQAQP